jgi:serine/threonine protein kinase
VGDLGVAKILNQTYFAKTFIGTPYYLSPEICEDKPYNDKSYVWALGCILYELCTYQHPFTARSQGGLIMKILNDNPKPINSYYSKELNSLIDSLFNKDFKKRPSCEEILKMNFVIEKAKSLGIFEDIKNSFPNIDAPVEKLKIKKNNINKINVVHVKPIIKSSNKNSKRPNSNYGILGRGGYNNLKFNNIKSGEKKKNQKPRVLCCPNNDKKAVMPKNKIIQNKDKNIIKSSNNKV